MAVDFKDFQKLNPISQILIVAVVCGGMLALAWYYILSPIQVTITEREAALAKLQGEVAKAALQAQSFEQFKKDSQELQVKLDELKSVLPSEKETDQLLRQARRSATSAGLRILKWGSPKSSIDHEVYTEWPVDIQVVGTYYNIGAFLDRIRQLPRIVNITNLKIQSRASEGEEAFTASVNATYTATTFVYREEIAENAPPPKPSN
jgi:type IV pilus assembly protein PilO